MARKKLTPNFTSKIPADSRHLQVHLECLHSPHHFTTNTQQFETVISSLQSLSITRENLIAQSDLYVHHRSLTQAHNRDYNFTSYSNKNEHVGNTCMPLSQNRWRTSSKSIILYPVFSHRYGRAAVTLLKNRESVFAFCHPTNCHPIRTPSIFHWLKRTTPLSSSSW